MGAAPCMGGMDGGLRAAFILRSAASPLAKAEGRPQGNAIAWEAPT
jgi:hypothetical protein